MSCMDGRVQHPHSAVQFPFRCAWLHVTLPCALEGRALAAHGDRREVRKSSMLTMPHTLILHAVHANACRPSIWGASLGWSKKISAPLA